MLYFIIILLILTKLLDQISGIAGVDKCGQLCDKQYMDAISPLNVDNDKQFIVLIVRDGHCLWVLDINYPNKNKNHGRRIALKGRPIESMFTVFDDPESSKQYNLTALLSFGQSGEIWTIVDHKIQQHFNTFVPLKGVKYNQNNRIDASYVWQPDPQTRILTIFQNNSYYRYDLNTRTQISGPDSLSEDFSYDFNSYGRLNGAFRRGNDIYLFHRNGYFIWKTENGKSGDLSEEQLVTENFYKCVVNFRSKNRALNEYFYPEDDGSHNDLDHWLDDFVRSLDDKSTSSYSVETGSSMAEKYKQKFLTVTKNNSNAKKPLDRERDLTDTTKQLFQSQILEEDGKVGQQNYNGQTTQSRDFQNPDYISESLSERQKSPNKVDEEDDIDSWGDSQIPTRKYWNLKNGSKKSYNSVKSDSINSNLLSNKLLIISIIVLVFKFF